MTIATSTPWLSDGGYDRQAAERLFGGGAYPARTVRDILDAVDADCGATGLNPGALLGQMAVETGWFRYTGDVRAAQYNYGGIGATGGGVPGISFATPESGVHGMVAHHGNYLFGDFQGWPEDWQFFQAFAVRNGAVLAANYGGTVRVVGDYGAGKWAADPDYAPKIVQRGNQIGAFAVAPYDYDVARPPLLTTPRSPNYGYRNGFAHQPQAIVWHITQGRNSLGWLCNPDSGASCNYLISRDGATHELVPPNLSAWANGDVKKPDTTNPLIRSWLAEGCNFNQRTISIENEGFTTNWQPGALTVVQQDALINLTAWLCDSLSIAPDRTHIIRHQQINDVDRHNCPGFSEDEEMLPWIAEIAAICGGGSDAVKEPKPGTVATYINAQGQPIFVWNAGGTTRRIEGCNIQDLGLSVESATEPGKLLDVSIIDNVQQPYEVRP